MDLFLEKQARRVAVQKAMREQNLDGLLITHPVHLFYITGRVFDGYYYLPTEGEGVAFVRRKQSYGYDEVVAIKSPKQLPQMLQERGIAPKNRMALEDMELPHDEYAQLAACFAPVEVAGGSALLRRLRMVKSADEIADIREVALWHDTVFEAIPYMYRAGMTDWELAAAVEYDARLKGHLGIMRCSGIRLESVFSLVLAGDNASAPSPYDYAVGGRGRHPSLPMGAGQRVLRRGDTVMVDFCGNIGGYLSDLTRTFAVEEVPDSASALHELARSILREMERIARPGVLCSELYQHAVDMVEQAGASDVFMGYEQQARFIGHGIGLQVNEWPVLTKNDHTPLAAGMIIAIEPKFTCPDVGPAGLENTYLVTEDGLERLTHCCEEIVVISDHS